MFDLSALLDHGDRTGLATLYQRDLDIPLLRKTLEHIDAHPEEHSQGEWVCKSGMCIAGHASILGGGTHVLDSDGDTTCLVTMDDIGKFRQHKIYGGIHIAQHAQYVLGLADGEASRMFYGENAVEDLHGMFADLETKGHLADWGVRYWPDGNSEWLAPENGGIRPMP